MKVKTIKLENFKGITVEHKLADATIITGPNGAGKSTVALGLKLALTGFLPVLGKRPGEIWQLAGNPEKPGRMAVTLVTEPKGSIHHEWMRNEKGTVSYAGALPPDIAWPESMLDFRRFLSLSGAEQAEEVFARCAVTAAPKDFLNGLDSVTGVRPEVVREVVQAVRDERPDSEFTLQSWIVDTLSYVKRQTSEAVAAEKRTSGALQLHVKNQPARADNVSADLAEAKKVLDQVVGQMARHTNAWRKYERELATWKAKDDEWHRTLERTNRDFEQDYSTARAKFAEVNGMHACPTCGTESSGWKAKWLADIGTEVLRIESKHKADIEAHGKAKPGVKPVAPEETPKELQQRMTECQAAVNALESKQRYHDGAVEWRRRRDALEIEAAEWTCRMQTWKEIGKRLAAWRDGLISAGIGKVLDVANQFTDGLLDAPLAWNEDRSEFGRRHPDTGGWIGLNTFGGFEEQLAFAALSVAIASQVKVKLVIMDEMGRMTSLNKVLIVKRMQCLITSGVIDQFVGIDVAPDWYHGMDRVKVIAL